MIVASFQPRRAAGFTLIEVIVAMAVASVVVLALAATLRIAFDARDSVNAVVDRGQARLVLSRALRGDFEMALRPTGGLATTFLGESEYLDGREADRLTFDTASADLPLPAIAPASTGAFAVRAMGAVNTESAGSRAQRVEYELLPTGDPTGGHDLVRYTQRYLLAEIEPVARGQVLLRGVRRLGFRYYDGADWLETWDAATQGNAIPVAVEVTCDFGRDRVERMVEVFGLPLTDALTVREPEPVGGRSSGGGGRGGVPAEGGGR